MSGHTIEELRRNTDENLPIVQPEPMRCKEHQEQLKIYCFTCNQLICRDGVLKVHKDHEFESISFQCAPTHKYYVCDQVNHRIQVFDQDLKHVSSFGRQGSKLGELNCPTDVAFDA